jgi:hypothetical protein
MTQPPQSNAPAKPVRWQSPIERAKFLEIDYIDITRRHFGQDGVLHSDFNVYNPLGERIVHKRIPVADQK